MAWCTPVGIVLAKIPFSVLPSRIALYATTNPGILLRGSSFVSCSSFVFRLFFVVHPPVVVSYLAG
jgi:hypothetical protein